MRKFSRPFSRERVLAVFLKGAPAEFREVLNEAKVTNHVVLFLLDETDTPDHRRLPPDMTEQYFDFMEEAKRLQLPFTEKTVMMKRKFLRKSVRALIFPKIVVQPEQLRAIGVKVGMLKRG